MSHISSGVEYALHCLLHLTDAPIGVPEASVRDLAELQGLSVEYVAKLFTKLHKAGLTVATEGARGGFKLARAASDISVWNVIEAVDGPKPLFDCKEIRGRCAVFDERQSKLASQGVCSIHAIMLEAEMRMKEVLQAQDARGYCEAHRDETAAFLSWRYRSLDRSTWKPSRRCRGRLIASSKLVNQSVNECPGMR